jgi:NAD(P)-dependent dehydrogenase (short-subunit alcohol dehydrogenase family)
MKGIGLHISRRFASEGAHVVLAENSKEAGILNEKFIKDSNHSAYFVETDVSQEESVKSLVAKVTQRFGAIHHVVNNAGIASFGNIFDENSVQNFDKVIPRYK